MLLPAQRQDIAVCKSPDGTRTVAVVGQSILLGVGGIEVLVEVRDGKGRALPGSYVIGMAGDWLEVQELRPLGAGRPRPWSTAERSASKK